MRVTSIIGAWLGALVCFGATAHGDAIVPVGAGAYTTALPPGAKQPQKNIYATGTFRGVVPTNRWWSSLAWEKYSDAQYPHPLAVQAAERGMRIDYPGNRISFNKDGVFGAMAAKTEDLILGLSTVESFPVARVDGCSDWFVRARFGETGKSLMVTYGHGSPFVYTLCEGGSPQLSFPEVPKVWSGDAKSAVLGITIRGNAYALFGPSGSSWQGVGTRQWVNQSGGKPYFSIAVLPAADEKTLALFKQYAYSHITDSQATPAYDPKTSRVSCQFTVTTRAYEGSEPGTIFALYPHQWRHTNATFLPGAYNSVRGTMKLVAGRSFTTTLAYNGVLPALPPAGGDPGRIGEFLNAEVAHDDAGIHGTYDDGKLLGRAADEVAIAEQYDLAEPAGVLRDRLRTRLEAWLTASEGKSKQLFCYDANWGTLIGYPAGYGSDVELNDHHFHYGYFVRAAAEIARTDPAWAADARFGGMIKLLIRDFASPDREDPLFPHLRNFDPYAGHSWASGHARFGDGNNEESSSEAINAWYGLILWGVATHDAALRDLGVWLYTTEQTAAREYWLEVNPGDFETMSGAKPPTWLAMIWGGKGVTGTWFSAKWEPRHGINWLPVHAGSLYLGLNPAAAARNYDALLAEKHGAPFEQWADIIWMYRALSDPADAMKQYTDDGGKTAPEAGNSRANLYHWLTALERFGPVDAQVTADTPLFAVFKKGPTRTYVVYNNTQSPLAAHFSDGHELRTAGAGFAVQSAEVKP